MNALTDDDVAALLPAPGSILRRRASDLRALAGGAGYALTLQVAHPTIAGGVRDHSTYATDPWGRAFRTADYIFLLAYGDAPTVANVARNLREMHRGIRGTDPSGRHYSALEPTAYAWVHATIAAGIVRGHQLMGTPLSAAEREAFWVDWLRLGTILGVRDGDLPETWDGFEAYLQTMRDDVLEPNDVLRDLKSASRKAIGGSPFRWLPSPVFAAVGLPLGQALRFLGIGMLERDLRERFGFPWTARHEAVFRAHCRLSRATTPVLPRNLRTMGPMQLKMRTHEVGPFGQVNAATMGAS